MRNFRKEKQQLFMGDPVMSDPVLAGTAGGSLWRCSGRRHTSLRWRSQRVGGGGRRPGRFAPGTLETQCDASASRACPSASSSSCVSDQRLFLFPLNVPIFQFLVFCIQKSCGFIFAPRMFHLEYRYSFCCFLETRCNSSTIVPPK